MSTFTWPGGILDTAKTFEEVETILWNIKKKLSKAKKWKNCRF
jgi:hypothetical protein